MVEAVFQQKILVVAAASLSLSVPVTAQAIVQEGASRIAVAMSDPDGPTMWDVDGDGSADFNIVNRGEPTGAPEFEFLSITSAGLNGRGFIGTDSNGGGILGLNSGVSVGPTLATGVWGVSDLGLRQVGAHTVTLSEPGFGLSWLTQSQQTLFVGFRFDSGRGDQYGWAAMRLDLTSGPATLFIDQWAYETEPDKAIIAGTIDAPASGLAALTLLGLGAAGLRRYRAQK